MDADQADVAGMDPAGVQTPGVDTDRAAAGSEAWPGPDTWPGPDGFPPPSVSEVSDEPLGLPEPGEITIIAMPDLQWYSLTPGSIPDDEAEEGRLSRALTHFEGGPEAPRILEIMHQWIVNEAERQRIAFVTYLGDLVERGGLLPSRPRWELARRNIDLVHGRIPYGIAVGNHDMETATGHTALFREYFGASRYAEFPWYLDAFEDNDNSAQRVALDGGGHLLFVHLTCNAPEAALAWADELLVRYPDDHVFLSTHMLLGPVEQHAGEVPPGLERGLMRWTKCYGDAGVDAQSAWDRLFRRHANIRAVLSGDQSFSQALHEVREGDAGNAVFLMMSDYRNVSRDGYLRILRYTPETGRIRVVTYSPFLDRVLQSTGIVPEPARHNFEVRTGVR